MEDISTAYSSLTCADILSIEEAFEGGEVLCETGSKSWVVLSHRQVACMQS